MKLLMRLFVGLGVALPTLSWAAEDAAQAPSNSWTPLARALAAGLAIGLASFGGSLGQGRAGAAALEGIARNPEASGKVMVPMILVLALIESLVIYSLVTALILIFRGVA